MPRIVFSKITSLIQLLDQCGPLLTHRDGVVRAGLAQARVAKAGKVQADEANPRCHHAPNKLLHLILEGRRLRIAFVRVNILHRTSDTFKKLAHCLARFNILQQLLGHKGRWVRHTSLHKLLLTLRDGLRCGPLRRNLTIPVLEVEALTTAGHGFRVTSVKRSDLRIHLMIDEVADILSAAINGSLASPL